MNRNPMSNGIYRTKDRELLILAGHGYPIFSGDNKHSFFAGPSSRRYHYGCEKAYLALFSKKDGYRFLSFNLG